MSLMNFSGKFIRKSSFSNISAMSFHENNSHFPLESDMFAAEYHEQVVGTIHLPLGCCAGGGCHIFSGVELWSSSTFFHGGKVWKFLLPSCIKH